MSWHQLILYHRYDIARILTYKTGRLPAESQSEIGYGTGFTWRFSAEAERIQSSVFTPSAPNRRTVVIQQSKGLAVALVPWNFLIAMVLRKAGAVPYSRMYHDRETVPRDAFDMLDPSPFSSKAGFEHGVCNVPTTSVENTLSLGEALCKHPLVKKVTFTSSSTRKKVTMELGGNCHFTVLNHANPELKCKGYLEKLQAGVIGIYKPGLINTYSLTSTNHRFICPECRRFFCSILKAVTS